MKPSIAVDIVANDKTATGRKSAERGFGASAKKFDDSAKRSGLGRIGQQVDGLSKIKNLSLGFDVAGKSLSSIGRTSSGVASGLASITERVVGFGAASESTLGGIAAAAGTAVGAIGGLAAAAVGLGVGAYVLGDKWAKSGAEIDRTSKTLGVNGRALQAARAENERFGVSSDATTASMEGLGTALYDAKYGANNLALGALTQMGVKLKTTKDGAVDVAAAWYDIADAIARQKDPMVQRKLAGIFGVSGALPALRQGSRALKAEGADYLGSGAALSDSELAQSSDVNKKTITARQHVSGAETRAGMAAEGLTGAAADKAVEMSRAVEHGAGDLPSRARQTADAAITVLREGAVNLGHGGMEAGRALVRGGERAGRAMVEGLEGFVDRIEHQESRGHQFDRHNQPLTSSAGAIGDMQLLPKTAEAAARRAGIAWDPQRFRTDKAYNKQLGAAELSRLLEKFNGDQVLAAAAYNAGEGVMAPGGYKDRQGRHHESWLKRFGDPRKGEISDADFAAQIPYKETRDYVANTANAAAAPQTAKAHVTIALTGAPAGTVAKVSGDPGVSVDMHVARSLEDH
jgi:soluble lytic murein transglycosylase